MNSVRVFRRSAREWLPAWRQVRSVVQQYQGFSDHPERGACFQRIDEYIKEVESSYAALDASSILFLRRECYRRDVRTLSLAIHQQLQQESSAEEQLRLRPILTALSRFEQYLYR